jgi:hypothetical protein
MSSDIRDLIRQMCHAHPLWGAPHVDGDLLKLGIEISQATVGRYMPWRPKATICDCERSGSERSTIALRFSSCIASNDRSANR